MNRHRRLFFICQRIEALEERGGHLPVLSGGGHYAPSGFGKRHATGPFGTLLQQEFQLGAFADQFGVSFCRSKFEVRRNCCIGSAIT